MVALAVAALSAWVVTAPEQRATWAWIILVLGLVLIAVATHWLWTVPTRPRQLLWDGHAWHMSTVRPGVVDELLTGRIDVAVDTGAWMLLRFHPDSGRARSAFPRRVIWLPAERRAAPHEWHALRYTLHGSADRSRPEGPGQAPGQAS